MNRTLGVIPPPLAEAFMTRTLMPHQKDEVIHSQTAARRYITYQGRVHDIERAIRFLKGSVAGFLVLAPLDWAKGVAPSRFNKLRRSVDITQRESSLGDAVSG